MLIALLAALTLTLSACGSAKKPQSQSTGASSTATQATNPNASTKAGKEERRQIAAGQRESISGLAPPGETPPATVLARVQGKPITFAQVAHRMAIIDAGQPLPDPPRYSACIARLKAEAQKPPQPGKESLAGKSEAQLKEACQLSYENLLQEALNSEIHAQWVLGAGAEAGLHVSEAEVRREIAQGQHQFKSKAEYEAYLQASGQSPADLILQSRINKLTEALFQRIKARIQHPTQADVLAYYDAHLASKYTIPEGRRIRILRTVTQAAAEHAKQQLKAGRSFQSLVAELSTVAQPLGAKNGEVADLVPNYYEEKALNDAIFSAKPHRLEGPVQVIAKHVTIAPESGSGSYVFEVLNSVPSRKIPFAQVKDAIAEELLKANQEETLKSGVAAIKARWKAKTTCIEGFIVKDCSEFKGSGEAIPQDPFTL